MSNTYIIDKFERVVPYVDGRKSLDTRDYRDATELELQQQKEIDELELKIRELESEAYDKRISELESKATAYDRLMSGGKKTPKEVANFFGKPIAMDMDGEWRVFYDCIPTIKGCCWTPTEMYEYDVIPSILIDFTGDWKDSLTLPDGWEA